MHLFFDLDDTLLDDSKSKDYYLPKLYKEFHAFIERDYESFKDSWIEAIGKFYRLYLAGKLGFAEQRAERIREAFNNSWISQSVLSSVDAAFLRYFQESWRLFDGWLEYLGKSQIRKSIITNGNGAQQRLKLGVLGISQFFPSVFVSEEVGFSKPNRGIFDIALSAVNERPDQCIMIGDSWEYDIVGGIGAGLRSFWINHRQEIVPVEPPNFETFTSIEAVIERLWEIEESGNFTQG